MTAKLTFQDVFNDEIAPSKFLVSPKYFTTGIIDPVFSAPTGSLYINTATGGFFLNISSPTPGTTWIELSNNSVNDEIGHHRRATETGLTITAAGSYKPSVGDLIGTFGLGAWSNSGNLNNTYKINNGCGTKNQAVNCGGDGVSYNLTETYNGATWTNGSALNSNRYNTIDGGGIEKSYGANIFGSANGAVVAGGYTGTAFLTSTELYNGSSWVNCSGSVPVGLSTASGCAMTGTSYTGLLCGGDFNPLRIMVRFNGATWASEGIQFPFVSLYNGDVFMSASGTSNNSIIHGYLTPLGYTPISYAYNGISAQFLTGTYNNTFVGSFLSGTSLMAIKAGGAAQTAPYTASNKTEIFNGITWNTHVDLNTARASAQSKAPGNVSNCVVMGGRSQGRGNTISGLNSSENYTETVTYKKLYPQYVKSFNKPSIYTGSNNSVSRSYQQTVKYPANKYLVVNRNALTVSANESDISSGYNVLQVSAGSGLGTYSVGASPSLQIVPGTISIITAGGANPLSTNNIGIFVVKSIIISSNTVVVANASATNQNPGTGTMKFITTMLCVDYIGSDDIVIGSVDGNGILTLDKMFQSTGYFSRTGK